MSTTAYGISVQSNFWHKYDLTKARLFLLCFMYFNSLYTFLMVEIKCLVWFLVAWIWAHVGSVSHALRIFQILKLSRKNRIFLFFQTSKIKRVRKRKFGSAKHFHISSLSMNSVLISRKKICCCFFFVPWFLYLNCLTVVAFHSCVYQSSTISYRHIHF